MCLTWFIFIEVGQDHSGLGVMITNVGSPGAMQYIKGQVKTI